MKAKILDYDNISEIGRYAQKFGGWTYGASATSLTCTKVLTRAHIVFNVQYNNDSVYNPRTGGFKPNAKPTAYIEIISHTGRFDLNTIDEYIEVLGEAKKILKKMLSQSQISAAREEIPSELRMRRSNSSSKSSRSNSSSKSNRR